MAHAVLEMGRLFSGGTGIVEDATTQHPELSLAGCRIALVGRLVSMSRREAERILAAHGARVVSRPCDGADVVVVGDDTQDLRHVAANNELFDDATRTALADHAIEWLHESELWSRLGLVEAERGVERLYTPAMLAELLSVPISAVRHWHRRGALLAAREVRRLPYFDFAEVGVARKLAELLAAGCSLSTIDRRLAELARILPGTSRPLADPAIVVEGRRLYVRRGEALSEPTGQLLIDFCAVDDDRNGNAAQRTPLAIPISVIGVLKSGPQALTDDSQPYSAEGLRCLAAECESAEDLTRAIEIYRTILISGQAAPEDHFALAELLYRNGDLSGARERYYSAMERDEDFVEARANLGCVLADLGDIELAEAAFRGALEFHPDYADAHYHLARLLDRTGRAVDATQHWQSFLDLAPASPWADEAHQRMAEGADP